jgi:hypothetical protein
MRRGVETGHYRAGRIHPRLGVGFVRAGNETERFLEEHLWMRILLIMAVVFGGLWLVDSFGFSGKHFKEVRQEADREIFLFNQQVDEITRAVFGR